MKFLKYFFFGKNTYVQYVRMYIHLYTYILLTHTFMAAPIRFQMCTLLR